MMVKKATLDDYRTTPQNSLFGSSDDDEFPDAEITDALVKESVYISMNRSYPGVPAWVTEVKSVNETDYLNMFVDADTNALAACDIARKYEDGGLPCGVNQIAALTWYKFAAETGSAEAAAHLVLIETDTNNLKKLLSGTVAKLDIFSYSKDINETFINALNVASRLLELNAFDETSVKNVNEILCHKKTRNAKQEIISQLRDLLNEAISVSPSLPGLVVVKQKIIDDADFTTGIYKNLQTRLALSAVNANLELIFEKLNQEFPWFEEANSMIYKQLQARLHSNTPAFKLRPLLLAGGPGVGKTSWAKRLAELCEVPFSLVMAAGSSDSMYLRGTPKGWSSARPSAVAKLIATERVANPLILVDEIDKTATDNRNGSILDVLLQLIEQATSKNYLDECLQVPCDFSWVSWIATCNTVGGLPKPLLDRFTVVLIEKPGPEHAQTIINGAIRAYANELGVDARMLPSLDGDDIEVLTPLSPREINRVVRMMLEDRLTETKRRALH